MENIIRILPDSVANQIAAGEVIQRPASVVKELVENAIDAGATQIDVSLKDAGRTLIRVADNGKGMSVEDAKLAFERHATSKIRNANDLFHLHTMGFRGEALASIASVAQVELVTRRADDELAWKVEIEGSSITNQEPTLASQGSIFTVRNLFFNIPARRKFLGENAKELKAIRDEFVQIALVNPDIQLSLTHNDERIYQLEPSPLKQRILNLFGKRNAGQLAKQLYPVDVNTQLIRIKGFVGDPTAAFQRDFLQYFFVNGRFIKHKAFRSAVMKAFELLISHGHQPTFFLYLEVDPEALDVNIHPTKTEVKFEHEQAIWPIVHATIREALGKANAVPSIDFDREDAPEIRVFTGDRDVVSPTLNFDPGYNPFKGQSSPTVRNVSNWDTLLKGFEKRTTVSTHQAYESTDLMEVDSSDNQLKEPGLQSEVAIFDPDAVKFQLLNTYLVVQGSHSLMLIHQNRAHIRILWEKYRHYLKIGKAPSQTLLYPESLDLDAIQRLSLLNIVDDLKAIGFNINCQGTDFILTAVPSDIADQNVMLFLMEMIDSFGEVGENLMEDRHMKIALQFAQSAAIPVGQKLSAEEIKQLLLSLFELETYKFTPDGKTILVQLTEQDLRNRFL